MNIGDIRLGSTVDLKFSTRQFSTGAPFTLAGSPAISAYVGNGTTEITAGITLSVDFDGRTGLNNVRVVATAANGYAAGTDVNLVITAGTVDGVSVVGEVIGTFSIEARTPVIATDNVPIFQQKYGVTLSGAQIIYVPIKKANGQFAIGADWTPASGDVKVMIDGGSPSNIGTLPTATAMGNAAMWGFVLSNTELTGKRVIVTVSDASPKAVEDRSFVVETYGNSAAMYPADIGASNTDLATILSRVGVPTVTLADDIKDLPTNAELATALGSADDAVLAAIATAQTGIDAIPTNAELATALGTADDAVLAQVALVKAVTDKLDDTLEDDAGTFRFTANALEQGPSGGGGGGLDAAGVRAAIGLASANLDTQLADLPTNAELATALGTADDAVLAQVALVKATTDKLDDTLEDDSGTFRFTTNALEQAPTGGGGGLDAAGVRAAVGLASANLDTQLADLPTNAELATALGTADDAVLSAIATAQTGINDIPTNAELATALASADDAVLAAVATAQTGIDAIPTNAELATALAAADDATLAQIALVKAKTDLIPAAPAAVSDVPSAATVAAAVRTTAMTESYAADGAAPTLEQMQFMVWAYLANKAQAGVVITANRIDGTTPAMTFTVDDADAPTSQTRTT